MKKNVIFWLIQIVQYFFYLAKKNEMKMKKKITKKNHWIRNWSAKVLRSFKKEKLLERSRATSPVS